MSVGLDLGTTEFRSIRDSADELIARRCRAVYLVVRNTPGHRRLIESTQARHAICGDNLVIFGDDAIECGAMLDMQAIPLLRNGRLPGADPVARQILALMLEAVLPPAPSVDAICCLTLPGGYVASRDDYSLDVRFLKQLVALRGYRPQLTTPGLAIVLSELPTASFSGLGISLGATNCEIGIIHCGRELARWSVAGNLLALEEEFPRHVSADSSDAGSVLTESQQQAWDRMCLRMLISILTEAREALVSEGSIRLIPQPAQLACSGGITSAAGFQELFTQAWSQAGWPLKPVSVHVVANPTMTVARGCLIQAIMNDHSNSERSAA